MQCLPRHFAKDSRCVHQLFPIAALNYNPEVYHLKYEALKKASAELRRNITLLEEFTCEVENMLQKCIDYLTEYRGWMLAYLQTEKETLSVAIEAAVQEATGCLDLGTEPGGGLARALWTLLPGQLQMISCSVSFPDLQTMCQTWATYSNRMHEFYEPSNTQVSEKSEQTLIRDTVIEDCVDVAPSVYAAVHRSSLELYDLASGQSTQHTLSVDFGDGGSYIAINKTTVLCVGSARASTAVYGLDLYSAQLTSLPPLLTARTAVGIAKAATFVYIFGGCDSSSNELDSCEKYRIADMQALSLGSMRYRRSRFTPCSFRGLIYLACAYPRTLESFSPETETFTVLPLSLPPSIKLGASVAFVANGELCILTAAKQMARCYLESESQFRVTNTERYFGSTQPPLLVDSTVLIACKGKVLKLSLDT